MAKRQYNRRTDEERIAELEQKIEEQREKIRQRHLKARALSPVVQEIPKVQKRLQRFAQLAMDNDRPDIANSTSMFLAGLHRIYEEERKPTKSEQAELDAFENAMASATSDFAR
ncbi:hypothetical protein [Engelhardtia mirabilis]|uniref:Uncharacterized protein n=1 Tax=Engelhardtia mirabilis TaxID=2528011 RepID=A0A518BIY1_9BACT|nr:hypothetical protein Pla133_20150 [Planctomycetes bacterium Pla133]QDV01267.1 hypothetical protein Pla86_20160 [Planctomycetes bacterium Pla86]